MGGRGAYNSISGAGGGNSSNGFSKTYVSRNGGSVYTEASRIEQAKMNKQEMAKYNKEHEMCKHLADNGHNVVHLDDRKLKYGSYDILLDGKKAELKSLSSYNNIVREGKSAIKKQGADLVVFRFDTLSAKAKSYIKDLAKAKIHGYYYVRGQKGLECF